MRGPPEVYARYIRLLAPVYRSDRRRAVPRLARRHRIAAPAAGRLPPPGSAMMLMRLAQLRLSWLRGVRRPLARRVLPPGDRFLWCRRSPAGSAALGRPAPGKRGHPAGQRNKLEKHVADGGSSNLHGGRARTKRLSRSDDAMLSGHTFVAVAAGPIRHSSRRPCRAVRPTARSRPSSGPVRRAGPAILPPGWPPPQ